MRIEAVLPQHDEILPWAENRPEHVTGDVLASPLDDLILARDTGVLAACHLLAPDEVQLVWVVFNNLDADPDYEPSDTMMTAIQAIIWKIAVSRVLASS